MMTLRRCKLRLIRFLQRNLAFILLLATLICFRSLIIQKPKRSRVKFSEARIFKPVVRNGQTFGLSWGFLDEDDYPDLFIGRHNESNPVLYLNRPGARSMGRELVEVTTKFLGKSPERFDRHGAQWVDINNDGSQDLFISQGAEMGWGGKSNHLYMNRATSGRLPFIDESSLRKTTYENDRLRMPLFWDMDSDGLVDVFLCSVAGRNKSDSRSNRLLKQGTDMNSAFKDITPQVKGISTESCRLALLSDLNHDGNLDLVVKLKDPPFLRAYSTSSPTFRDIGPKVNLPQRPYNDIVFADFNNDLAVDMMGVLPCKITARTVQVNPYILESKMSPGGKAGDQDWIQFYTKGHVTVVTSINHAPQPAKPTYVTIAKKSVRQIVFEVPNPETTSHLNLEDLGWFRFWNSSNGHSDSGWFEVRITSSGIEYLPTVYIMSSEYISELSHSTPKLWPNHLMQNNLLLYFSENSIMRRHKISSDFHICGESMVSADFDNDMDIDVFVLRSSLYCERRSLFLWNEGSGDFTVEEATNIDCENHYRPESVAITDYNLDGFIDLSITSGSEMDPFRLGSYGLYNNGGNGNNWIEIRVFGSKTVNRDGIGTKVIAITSDGVRQQRLQDGGMHARSQNWQILHFGLGNNLSVDLIVCWPDRSKTTKFNIEANQTIHIDH